MALRREASSQPPCWEANSPPQPLVHTCVLNHSITLVKSDPNLLLGGPLTVHMHCWLSSSPHNSSYLLSYIYHGVLVKHQSTYNHILVYYILLYIPGGSLAALFVSLLRTVTECDSEYQRPGTLGSPSLRVWPTGREQTNTPILTKYAT